MRLYVRVCRLIAFVVGEAFGMIMGVDALTSLFLFVGEAFGMIMGGDALTSLFLIVGEAFGMIMGGETCRVQMLRPYICRFIAATVVQFRGFSLWAKHLA